MDKKKVSVYIDIVYSNGSIAHLSEEVISENDSAFEVVVRISKERTFKHLVNWDFSFYIDGVLLINTRLPFKDNSQSDGLKDGCLIRIETKVPRRYAISQWY